MPTVEEIVDFLDDLLDSRSFADWCPNGLQVAASPGRTVERVATCVSAHAGTIEQAIAIGASLIVAHHGLVWGSQPQPIVGPARERLRLLLCSDVALAAYHLPLDAHPEVGNNALLARALGLAVEGRFADVRGHEIGVVATVERALAPSELAERVRRATGRDPLHLPFGPPEVRRVGIVSGAGADALGETKARKLDALVTGEPREAAFADARELGVHFFAAGHYATEKFGVRRLGELVAERFGVEHTFVDFPNPI